MDKNTKVILTEKWWKDNKAKTLSDKGNLAAALKAFETAYTNQKKGGPMRYKPIKVAIDACYDLDKAAKDTASKCDPKLHGDTKYVLLNTFQGAVDKVRNELRNDFKYVENSINSLTAESAMKDKSYFPLLYKFTQKESSDENILFIVAVEQKKYDKAYDMFLSPNASKPLNLDFKYKNPIDQANNNGQLNTAPWKTALDQVYITVEQDTISKFKKYLKG